MVFHITQDHQGFIWIATANGLNRYNGSNCKVFLATPDQEEGLTENRITFLFEDNRNNLWIGTRGGGLNQFDPNTEKFKTFRHQEGVANSLSNDEVLYIYQDSKERLWIGTENGLNLFDYQSQTFSTYLPDPENPTSLSSKAILSMLEDHRGNIWVGTWAGGLNLMIQPDDPNSLDFQFLPIRQNSRPDHALTSDHVWSLLEDSDHRLWVGTFEGGINLMIPPDCTDYSQCSAADFQFAPVTGNLRSRQIYMMLQATDGELWVGTNYGIYRLDLEQQDPLDHPQFIHYISTDKQNALPSNEIRVIFEDKEQILWFGSFEGVAKFDSKPSKFELNRIPTIEDWVDVNDLLLDEAQNRWISTSDGLFLWDHQRNTYQRFRHPPGMEDFNNIHCLFQDMPGTIWLGSEGGLSSFDIRSRRFTVHNEVFSTTGHGAVIWKIRKDSAGRIWICSRDGLIQTRFPITASVRYLAEQSSAGTSGAQIVSDLVEDAQGNLWISSNGGGLFRLNFDEAGTPNFQNFQFDPSDPSTISSNQLLALSLNAAGNCLWLGSESGMCHFDLKTGKASRQLAASFNSRISGLVVDDESQVWFTSPDGLFRLDEKDSWLSSYDEKDGTLESRYTRSAYRKLPDGRIFFGGKNAYQLYDPKLILPDTVVGQVLITDLKLSNRSVLVNEIDPILGEPILKENIFNTKTITLSHQHRTITLEFAILDLFYADNYSYSYQLQGWDEDWYHTKENRVTYSSLSPGTYTFWVKARNNDGRWSDATALVLEVMPPFYQEVWFRSLMAILALSGVLFYGWLQQNQGQKNTRKLEALVVQRNREIVPGLEQPQTGAAFLSVDDILRDSEGFFRSLYQRSPLGIVFCDRTGRILKCNARFSKILGADIDRFRSEPISHMLPEQEKTELEQRIRDAFDSKKNYLRHEVKLVRGREENWYDLAISLLLDKDGNLQYMIGMLGDISERKAQEKTISDLLLELQHKNEHLEDSVKVRTQDLVKSNDELKLKNEELERFAFIASHDLKEPVRNISSFLGLIQRRMGQEITEEVQEYFGFIQRNTLMMHHLISDVLEYSRVNSEVIKLEAVDLVRIMDDVTFFLADVIDERQAALHYPRTLPTIQSKESFLFLILKNLVSNGIKYNNNERPEVKVDFSITGNMITLFVSDNGIGIAPEYHDQIFEMFKRLHNRMEYIGSGIGLAVCKRITTRLGGNIRLESNEGAGSTFIITIPY